jgi:hypothetical protein
MNTMQFLMAILNWLQGDPSHVVVAACLLRSFTATPNPATPLGKIYKVLELFALSFYRAKETGEPAPTKADAVNELAALLTQQLTPIAVSTTVAPTSKVPA